MNLKTLIWIGILLGSAIGSYVPMLWGADLLSFASLIGSVVGSFVGMWGAYKINHMLDI